MKTLTSVLALALVLGGGTVTATLAGGPKAGANIDTNTVSTAAQTIDGKLLKIDGDFYVIEDLNGKQARLHISKNTKLVNGKKKPGDVIRAEVNKSGHILSIQ